MTVITIPKETDKNQELIAVPKKAFEEFLTWQEKIGGARTFKLTKSELKSLKRGRKNFKEGKYITWETLKNELANRRRSKGTKRNR